MVLGVRSVTRTMMKSTKAEAEGSVDREAEGGDALQRPRICERTTCLARILACRPTRVNSEEARAQLVALCPGAFCKHTGMGASNDCW